MSIVKMSKVSLAGPSAERDHVIASVMKLGLVEIVSYDGRNSDEKVAGLLRADADDGGAAEAEREMAAAGSAIDVIERFVPEKKPMFFSGKPMRADEYKTIVHDLNKVKTLAARINEFDAELTAMRNEENRLNTTTAALAPWRAMPLPLERTGTAHTKFSFGTLPAACAIDRLRSDLAESAPESYIDIVSADQEFIYVVTVAHASCAEAAAQTLKQYAYARTQFKELTGTPEQNIENAESRLEEIEKCRAELEKKIASLAPLKTKIQVLYDYMQIRADRKRIVSKLGRSGGAFYMEGWLPSDRQYEFIAKIGAEAECYIEIEETAKGENHPILLKNPALVKPFEAVTAMYSLPSANDVDPNLVMAPFYFLFFGLMIGDFVYGIILAIAIAIMINKFKPAGTAGKILRMLFLGGISTAFWGAMFGSYMGNLPQVFMGWITGRDYSSNFYGIWFDPLSDPMKLLIFSMVFGVVHLFAGMGLKIYMLLKEGKWFEAVFDVGSWYVLIIGLPLLFLMEDKTPGIVMSALGAAMLLFTQGRTAKNPLMKFANGLLSLYGITGYLGDVLSYSRLLALGLATGVIAAVVNTLGTLNAPGVVGVIVLLIVLAVGSVFNIAINALGAFVHSSRLQYVEFFSKFYEGGGEEFKPFMIKTKYIKVK